MKETYLVLGATGHLGLTLCKELVSSGQRVKAMVLKNDPLIVHLPKEVRKQEGDVLDVESMKNFFKHDIDEKIYIIDCAGIISLASNYVEKQHLVNVQGMKNILTSLKGIDVGKMVYVSSVHAIPSYEDNRVISEIDHFDPNDVKGDYAKTKAEASQLFLDAVANGLNGVIVHPSGIIGPNDYGHSHLTRLFVDYEKGKLTALVKGGYNFVDARDVAKGIIEALDKGRKGECYLLTNEYYEIRDVIHIASTILNKKDIKTIIPMWLAKLTAPLSELYYKIRKVPALYTSYSLYTLTSNSRFTNKKAKDELGFTTRPIENTIRNTLNFISDNKVAK